MSPRGWMFMASTISAPNSRFSPVAHEAQPLDENSLDEDHRHERAEDIAESAQDRIGDGEGRQHDTEVQVLDVRRVVGVDGAADAGDEATGGERADLHRRQVDADALSGQLVLADGPQNGAPRVSDPSTRAPA